jgi:GntR family transcriptional repressor for pyruvate dehydrogenase complex
MLAIMNHSPAPRKADRVARDLMRCIVSGHLEVGSLLPREAELAVEYGVNRGVVREAIKLLEVHRLVRPVRRLGTRVLDPLRSLSPDVLATMLMPAPGRLDGVMLRELLEVRALIDGEMCAVAAERRTEEDLRRLEAGIVSLAERLHDPAGYAEEVDRFAESIAVASHNRIYLMMVHWHRQIRTGWDDFTLLARSPSEPHLQGLAALEELIAAGEAAAARELVETFHRWITPRILALALLRAGEPLPEVSPGSETIPEDEA